MEIKLAGFKLGRNKETATFLFLIVLAVIPLGLSDQPYYLWVLMLCIFYAILAVNWDLLLGYGRLLSFAHTGLLGVGAYISAYTAILIGVPAALGMMVGGLAAAAAGLLIGWICLRLRGIYLALATWGFSGIVQRILIAEYERTGGMKGMSAPYLLPFTSSEAPLPYYYIALAILVIDLIFSFKLINSRFGLILRAMGDDEEACSSLGINITFYKVALFVLTSFWIGLAGAFNAHLLGYVTPAIADFLTIMIATMAATIIGGLGTLLGPLIGAFLIYLIMEYARATLGALQQLIVAVIFLLSLKFFRNGIMGLFEKGK